MITMTELTIEPLKRGLQQMSGYLDHAQKHIIDYGIAPDSLLAARLAPGMMTFSAQVQRASDNAKNGVARLTGTVAPVFPDTEADIEQLKTRLGNTAKHLETLTGEDFAGAERRLIQLRFLSINGDMTGFEYLTRFLLPNFYFHIATAHAICDIKVSQLARKSISVRCINADQSESHTPPFVCDKDNAAHIV